MRLFARLMWGKEKVIDLVDFLLFDFCWKFYWMTWIFTLKHFYSQRISLKFSSELGLLISNLTEQLKTKIEESLQERMYNILGEKYENIIYGVTYKKVGAFVISFPCSANFELNEMLSEFYLSCQFINRLYYISICSNSSRHKERKRFL